MSEPTEQASAGGGRGPGAGGPQGPQQDAPTTHFGFSTVREGEKAGLVADVFRSVAPKYDLMNDVMSGGLHRLWKAFAVRQAGVRPGMHVLDVAGGTGDLARAFAQQVGPTGRVVLTDINGPMLAEGRDRLLDAGQVPEVVQCDAEHLPFADASFDRVMVSFGLRNMTHKEAALAEMRRVLRPGGRLLVLEFSRVWAPLEAPYHAYLEHGLPWLGARIAADEGSYRYLGESIRVHPSQEELAAMMREAGLERVRWFNFAAGVCALHEGVRL
jgi:demethylmenaquinone methyltransferase/2-methoxy-6-polyprenyl-1,4-benzoquinol methylase